jgi:hypothetical protein
MPGVTSDKTHVVLRGAQGRHDMFVAWTQNAADEPRNVMARGRRGVSHAE